MVGSVAREGSWGPGGRADGFPMKVAVLGPGGVGGYYGGELARAGHEVRLLARGEHLAALRERGLEVRTPDGDFAVKPFATGDPAELGPVDLVLVTVKAYSLSSVVPIAARLAREGADVVPLLNGVEAADRLREGGVPAERLLGGVTAISATKIAPGVIERRSPFRRVVVGELAGGLSERAERIAALFREAGAEARASAEIEVELWRKLVFLATLSGACGLARAPVGPVREAELGLLLLERAVAEVAAVGRASGVPLPADEEERAMAFIQGLPGEMLPSFVLDLEAGGPTELDILSGAVARLGRDTGVPTLVHDTMVAALDAALA
jgi:2-dehydropantoate 2-reductase